MLPGAGWTDVEEVAERIRRLVSTSSVPTEVGPLQVPVSLAGLSWPAVDARDPEELLAKLDIALYQSKERGRDRLTMVAATRSPDLS